MDRLVVVVVVAVAIVVSSSSSTVLENLIDEEDPLDAEEFDYDKLMKYALGDDYDGHEEAEENFEGVSEEVMDKLSYEKKRWHQADNTSHKRNSGNSRFTFYRHQKMKLININSISKQQKILFHWHLSLNLKVIYYDLCVLVCAYIYVVWRLLE